MNHILDSLVDKNCRQWEIKRRLNSSPNAVKIENPMSVSVPVIKTDSKKSIGLGIVTGLVYAALLSSSVGFMVEIQTRLIILLIVVAGCLTGIKFGFFYARVCGLLGGVLFGFLGMFAASLFSLSGGVFLSSNLNSETPVSTAVFQVLATVAMVLSAFALNIVISHLFNSWRTKKIISNPRLAVSFAASFVPLLLVCIFFIFQFVTGWK